MFMKLLILLLFFVKCKSLVEITIDVGATKNQSKVTYSGVDEKLISDKDVRLFNVTDDKLKRGVRIELGKEPDEIFIKDPTPYDNLYEIFDWKEVNRDIRVKDVEIYDVVSKEVVLKTSNHINNTTFVLKSKIALFDTLENTIKTTWSEGGYPEITNLIININNQGKTFKINQSWKKNETKFMTLRIGASRKGFINLHPGKIATTVLTAKKTIMILKVRYATSLSGCVVANYSHVYGKYHFWSPKIQNIMKNVKMKSEIITSEVLEVKTYTDPVVNVFNTTTKEVIKMITPLKALGRKLKKP